MRSYLHIWTKKSLIAATLLCLNHLLFFTAFGQGNPVGANQQPKVTESRHGDNNEYHDVTTTYPDGTRITIKYLVRTIDNKPFEIKIATSKQTSNRETNTQAYQDTSYWDDGVTIRRISQTRYKPGNGDTLLLMESSTFDKMGNQESGWKQELGIDFKMRHYQWNTKTKEYDLKETYGRDIQTSSCPAPKSVLSVQFLVAHNPYEELNYQGVELGYSFYFNSGPAEPSWSSNGDSAAAFHSYLEETDSVRPYAHPPRRRIQFGVGGNTFFVFANDQDFKFNLSGLTAGPEIRFTKNNFSGAFQVQAGAVREGFKYDDFKEDKTCFALRTGIVIDAWFFNKVGVEVSPQVLMTTFEETKWSFMGGIGLSFKLGCTNK